ncbi:MAG: NAD+ synthase [bacterium]
MEILQMQERIIDFIKNNTANKAVVLGLSGGIDSSVIANLAVKALGSSKVFGLIMPSSQNQENDLTDAIQLSENLKIKYEIIQIDEIIKSFEKVMDLKQDKKALGNLMARIRMCLLYAKAGQINGLVVGTGNKSEIMAGYFTKYGDGGADILPLGGLIKTQVFEMARFIGMDENIINKKPSAGLWKGQSDEDELGITYCDFDKIVTAIEKNEKTGDFSATQVALVQKYIDDSKHKRLPIPVCKFD